MTRDEMLKMPAGSLMDITIAGKFFGIANTLTPNYSTDIAAAWEVFEKFRADGNEVSITSSPKGWECLISSTAGYAKTVPLAICRAALLAVTE